MTSRWRPWIVTALLALSWTCLELYRRQQAAEQFITAPVLKENETQKIIVDTSRRRVQVVRRVPVGKGRDEKGGTTQAVKVTEGARKVVVTEHTDGTVQVTAVNKGFIAEPGLALYYSDRARIGLDVQVAYWKQWGVVLGAGLNLGDEPRTIRGHIAVTRALPLDFLSNTSAFVGVDHKKEVVAGLRLRF